MDGFGVSGVEGVYRRCCEITLSVLRQHKGSIIRWGQSGGGWVHVGGRVEWRVGGWCEWTQPWGDWPLDSLPLPARLPSMTLA